MWKALSIVLLAAVAHASDSRPKVRAVTAFVRIDAKAYASQLEDAMQFLNGARDGYRKAGYDVEGCAL